MPIINKEERGTTEVMMADGISKKIKRRLVA
jgi:hypothetical protein